MWLVVATPAEPMLILPGLALAYAMNSATVFTGSDGWTTITLGPYAKPAAGAICLSRSKDNDLLFTVALMALADVTESSV